ncbi:hypothetical protein GWI33_020010 [Rhynchophorus ferrugineus]|uniref:Uncharacterized protein n=1 Tax=Rhynchophorus ferrugineus TaxID=354439 RepID=A0A834HS55_RHYFE|nr:hypothetical protein GWI33_020010 [Rhynchophorus ferrugineus]
MESTRTETIENDCGIGRRLILPFHHLSLAVVHLTCGPVAGKPRREAGVHRQLVNKRRYSLRGPLAASVRCCPCRNEDTRPTAALCGYSLSVRYQSRCSAIAWYSSLIVTVISIVYDFFLLVKARCWLKAS